MFKITAEASSSALSMQAFTLSLIHIFEAMNAASMSTDDVYVYGIDGLYQGCKAVEEGMIRATCYNDCQKFAEVYLDRVKKLQSGEIDASYVEDVVLTPVRIDKSNVQEYLDFYKENGFDK